MSVARAGVVHGVADDREVDRQPAAARVLGAGHHQVEALLLANGTGHGHAQALREGALRRCRLHRIGRLGVGPQHVAGVGKVPAGAVDDRTVGRFVALSDQIPGQLASPATAGLSRAQKRARAVCILTRFETAYGADGVRSLMGLMGVLSKGAEFDDATIVAFNDRFGSRYDQIVRRCTRAAGS